MRSGAGPIFVLYLFAVAVSSTTIPSRARALEGNQEQQIGSRPQEAVVQGGRAPTAEAEEVEDAATPSLSSPVTPQNPTAPPTAHARIPDGGPALMADEDTDDETTDEDVTEEDAEDVTEEDAEDVTEESDEDVTEEEAEDVTEEEAEDITEQDAEDVTEGSAPEETTKVVIAGQSDNGPKGGGGGQSNSTDAPDEPGTGGGEALLTSTIVVALSVVICGIF